ncbi:MULTISPECIES: glycosyltransferase family 2 protein [unclassified Arthrobacter]|uniref:glycosyltransferase family 2 protein n=1 Tax=unclassified Arthrobacter TaxID=235627 RepID=UPI002DFDF797|nr:MULTISPECIES: glycosyltransferase family 2 protein [unclassified Arthrobacter]MEC5191924.1 glycosyltransferase involved in cell wall biosynthesis [Arthrobacter sp. MP_M4]MEC5202429.1 glycosyltransferase involved in cell wall biosynthesis [Arthrobacter sp. MP_M7]
MTGAMVDVVLPCLNERGALPWVLSRMPDGYRAIVVDNGSTDGSAELAASLGALVVHEDRRGFGAAAHAGLLAATAEFVAFCDCDGSLDPAQLPALVAPVLVGTAELVLGSRQPQRGSWPLHARIANIVLAWRLRRLTGERVSDLGPMRAARRLELLSLELQDRRSGYPLEMFLKASLRKWRIVEIPVPYAPRTGKSKVTGTLRGTVTAVRDMSAQLKAAAAASPAGPVRKRPGSE